MMRNYLLFAILTGIIFTYNACKKETSCTIGNGDVVQEQRELDTFKEVSIIGAFTTTIYQGQNSTVDFFAESNIIPLIRTDVSNLQLRIILQDGSCYSTNQAVAVSVNSPDYEQINIDGSGNVNANNLNLDELTFNLNGSGNLSTIIALQKLTLNLTGSGNANIVGNGNQGDYTLSGSGNIYASNFLQDTVYVSNSGSGDVHINVSALLDVTITGSGNVYYKGDPPTIHQNITGSGQLIKE